MDELLPEATAEPTRDDVVLFAEAVTLFPSLTKKLQQTQRRLPVPRPLDRSPNDQKNPDMRPDERWDEYEERRDRTIRARLTRLRRLVHRLEGDDVSTALCLSGGGIRSATFSLGVVQGLAIKKVLPDFHYLSTVSGGGYLGSLLSAWIRNKALWFEAEAEKKSAAERERSGEGEQEPVLPRSVADKERSGESQQDPVPLKPEYHSKAREHVIQRLASIGDGRSEEPKPVKRLRSFSNYLSPMRGVSADFLTLLAIYARNLILNWLVLIPALFACLMIPRFYLAVLQMPAPADHVRVLLAVIAWVLVGWTIAYMASDLPAPPSPPSDDPKRKPERLDGPPPLKPDRVFLQMVLPLTVAALLVSCLVGWEATAPSRYTLWGTLIPTSLDGFFIKHGITGPWQATIVFVVLGIFTQGLSSILGGVWLRKHRHREDGKRPADWAAWIAVSVAGGLTGAALYWLVAFLLTIPSETKILNTSPRDMRDFALWSSPLVMTVFWLGVTLYAGWRRPVGLEDEREWWARAAARWMLPSVIWVALCALVFYLPGALLSSDTVKYFFTSETGAAAAGVGAGAFGLLVAIGGFLINKGPAWRQKAESFAAKAGMRVFDLIALAFIIVFLALMSMGVTSTMRLSDRLKTLQEQPFVNAKVKAAEDLAKCEAASAASAKPSKTDCEPVPCGGAKNPCPSLPEKVNQRYTLSLIAIEEPGVIGWAIVACFVLVAIVSYRIGVNTFSLHSLYGNRLVRAYLAASRRDGDRRPHWFTGFDPKDNLPVHETWPERDPSKAQDPKPRLMHVINIALNMVKASESRLEWQDRKATSFTVTPLYSGSAVTGYIQSKKYLKTPHINGISLGCAMTISGAAASPNMGYHSSLPLAIVMTLFNVRLGMWLPNPRWMSKSGWPQKRDEPAIGFEALIDEALGDTSAETPYLYLSDGGHFDNTGIYEMVRRRVRHIVLVDAGADPEYQFDDLLSTVRKIRIDMGITVEFTTELPGPKDKGCSGAAVGIAKIRYSQADANAKDGTLVFYKPALVPNHPDGPWLPNDVRRYAAESARGKDVFPQQPTSDQFFDEAQFESYRMLGLHAVLATYGPTKPGAGGEPRPQFPPGFLGLAEAATLLATPPPPPPFILGQGPPPPPAPPPEKSEAEVSLFAAIRDNAGILATTALVSAATAGSVTKLASPPNPDTATAPTPAAPRPPAASAPASAPSQSEGGTRPPGEPASAASAPQPPASAASGESQPASAPTSDPKPVLGQKEIDKLVEAARSSAAAASSASHSASVANESLSKAVKNAESAAGTAQRAVDAAARAADAAASSAATAKAIEAMAKDISEIRRNVPPRANGRSGEGSK